MIDRISLPLERLGARGAALVGSLLATLTGLGAGTRAARRRS